MGNTQTGTLEVPGATLYYEVRGSGPLLVMTGGANDAGAFEALAELLADRYTVATHDTRGYSRSTLDRDADEQRVDAQADDVARLIEATGTGPICVLGSSGGAVVGLELVTSHPDLVETLVAHEPPLTELLPDAKRWHEFRDELRDICRSDGVGPAMQMFYGAMGFDDDAQPDPSQLPPEVREAMKRIEENLSFFLEHGVRVASYVPDVAALEAASTRVVVGGGSSSGDQLPNRTAAALAARLGQELARFSGDHMGFTADPAAFAEDLRRELGDEG